MIRKATGYRVQGTVITVSVLFFLLAVAYRLSPVLAQSASNCGGGSLPRAQGLVTAPQVNGKFGTSGACITDSKVAFAPFKIPTYDDLKSTYFTQAKNSASIDKQTLNGDKNQGDIPLTGNTDHLYYIQKTSPSDGNLTISSNIPGNQTGIIFVDKNLNINSKITSNNPKSGIVFVVSGDVAIDPSVTQIDAAIISLGTIYTAGANCNSAQPIQTSQLVINGALISLNPDKTIQFCRKLVNNNLPSEVVNTEFKYLAILRDLMSDTLQKWSEVP